MSTNGLLKEGRHGEKIKSQGRIVIVHKAQGIPVFCKDGGPSEMYPKIRTSSFSNITLTNVITSNIPFPYYDRSFKKMRMA